MHLLGLRLLLLAVVLMAVGWTSFAHAVFEVIRVVSILMLSLALGLLIVDFVRTPDPAGR
jgi:hypothetical protein